LKSWAIGFADTVRIGSSLRSQKMGERVRAIPRADKVRDFEVAWRVWGGMVKSAIVFTCKMPTQYTQIICG
jgi:hypothetical protein